MEFGMGTLQLSPDEFWGLTFSELNIKARGFKRYQRAEWTKYAQQAVWILNAMRKKNQQRVKVEHLIGHEDEDGEVRSRKKTTEEESKQFVNELIDQFGHDQKYKYH